MKGELHDRPVARSPLHEVYVSSLDLFLSCGVKLSLPVIGAGLII